MKRQHIAACAGLGVLVGLAAATAGYAALGLQRSKRLARRARPFERSARAEGARLLVVGDSTAAGAGASAPESSLPGLLGRANPSLTVVNRAEPGARFADIAAQLEGDERFDAVLVLGGTHDVLHGTRDAALRESIQRVAQRARVRSEVVVFVPPGNLGNLRIFPPPWSWWMTYRARRLQALVADLAQANGARHVSLFLERDDDPFARHPRRLSARDGLHPNDAGYELWQRELETQAQLSAKLRKIGRAAAVRTPLP
ncbi:SGNH/GDSL hydrolase family protein [Variovorax saccharolyticus]|uniref:SGNH/GDSL hydrolase family protein n=1 Tax=Variovorax saccharolyticus TaxID=3053516 RepID=UPI0025756F6B|nr:GDSL-type esterase/lipase family protein [Variovorax sp. J22R187]MDM0019991.1 GDSL-type esterase/lipase family protein [Variovorax sp. J22R187]